MGSWLNQASEASFGTLAERIVSDANGFLIFVAIELN